MPRFYVDEMRWIFIISLLSSQLIFGQKEYYFSKLTVEDGLSDAHVQSIGQDKFGFMWFGSLSGVSRFDGRNITQFYHRADDSTTILSEMAHCFKSDFSDRFYIGFANGLAEFDFKTRTFHRIAPLKGIGITNIIPIHKDLILLTTLEGLGAFNPNKNEFHFITNSDLLKGVINDGYLDGKTLYLTSKNGLISFDIETQTAQKVKLPLNEDISVRTLCIDNEHNFWLSTQGKYRLLRISADFKKADFYDKYFIDNEPSATTTFRIVKDPKGRIWVCTKYNGILEYIAESNSFVRHMHNPEKRWSPSNSAYISLFCSREGIIWGGGGGINYFHPDRTLFKPILPFETELSFRQRRYARCAIEDKNHVLWLGTRDGLVQYDPKTQSRKEWRNVGKDTNVLAGNIVLDLYCDDENNIWIATTAGLSRFNRKTGTIETLSGKNGFPKGMYKCFYRDKNGVFWIGMLSNDGLYFYDSKDKKLHSAKEHPQLNRFAGMPIWTILQDNKGRFWYALDEKGLGLYDPKTQKTEIWTPNTEGGNTVAGAINIDIKEDKKGIIWVSSFSGLTSIDFHSTWDDIFYTNITEKPTNMDGLIKDWFKELEASIPNYKVNARGSKVSTGVISKAFFNKEFNAEALVYEVGDNTSRDFTMLKAKTAALKLMQLSLKY